MIELDAMHELQFNMDAIRVVHSGALERNAKGDLIFSDSTARDWHLLRLYDEALCNVMVGLEICVLPTPCCQTDFYINAMGGIDVAVVSSSGLIRDRGISRALEIETHKDGSLTVCALYESRDGSATFGTFQDRGVYAGSGMPQFIIKSIKIYLRKGPWIDSMQLTEKITLVDIGAAGGLQGKWDGFTDRLRCIFFEPAEKDADELQRIYAATDDIQVIAVALSNVDGTRDLHLTRFPQCSSLLRPNYEVISKYKVASCFDVVSTEKVPVRRYDSLWREKRVPRPEVIKIDVQGAEYEVLEGFGQLLKACIGIELETHFYQIYEGQKLVCDLVAYLGTFGLYLRKLEPQLSFDCDLVEVNAYFTKRRSQITTSLEYKKLQIVEHVWGLREESPTGALLAIEHGRG